MIVEVGGRGLQNIEQGLMIVEVKRSFLLTLKIGYRFTQIQKENPRESVKSVASPFFIPKSSLIQ